MPKIRGIKPEFWTDEDIVELSLEARLLFIGLWNLACDNGHVSDKPKQIKMRLLPADDVDVDNLLTELAENGRLVRVDGTITVTNFAKHQKPHRRWWSVCDLPLCTIPEDAPEQGFNRGKESSVASPQRENNRGATVAHGGTTADGDGDGDGELRVKDTPRKRAVQLPEGFVPNEANIQLAISEGVDLRREFSKFCDHNRAKGATYKDWHLALNNWIRKAAEYGGNVRPLQRPGATDQAPHLPIALDDRR